MKKVHNSSAEPKYIIGQEPGERAKGCFYMYVHGATGGGFATHLRKAKPY
ncbi:MAG: hypothetical protein H7211_07820 [Aquabacterium sp.]|nr:hypothetical protein [Ferruginibacter sp.]